MDPTTTLFTFMLKTQPSVRTVHLLGSWDNFTMAYVMERDSRRDRGQWRGCHTYKDIICDGDDPSQRVPRSGGLKMGNTYYYYYELDASTETHDPAMPSTTACPYLPGQRVNMLCMPTEQSVRQRCASAGSVHRSNYQTMNPADRFATPRQPSTTPTIRLASAEPETAIPPPPPPPPPRSSSPKLWLRQPPRSAPNSSPLSASTWSPRRLFTRRPSPARNVMGVEDSCDNTNRNIDESTGTTATVRAHRLVSWRSSSSLSSIRRPAAPPSQHSFQSTSSSQGGSRSRDISPESLRRFLVEDAPPKEDMADTNAAAAASAADDEADDDEHNFAMSAASESAPLTILSPPPPPRAMTPVPFSQKEEKGASSDETTLPKAPSRSPPSIPATTDKDARAQFGRSWLTLSPMLSAASPPLPALSFRSHNATQGSVSSPSCSVSQSETEDDDLDYEAFSLPPRHIYGQNNGKLAAAATSTTSSKVAQERHDHIIAALDSSFPDSNSTSTLVPGRLGDLTDELGWMATAIRG